MKLNDSVERADTTTCRKMLCTVPYSTGCDDRMRYTPPASPISCIHISRIQLLMHLERRNDHVSPMVDHGQRKEGNNDRVYHTHTHSTTIRANPLMRCGDIHYHAPRSTRGVVVLTKASRRCPALTLLQCRPNRCRRNKADPPRQGTIHIATAPAHRSRVVEAHSSDEWKPHDWPERKRLNDQEVGMPLISACAILVKSPPVVLRRMRPSGSSRTKFQASWVGALGVMGIS